MSARAHGTCFKGSLLRAEALLSAWVGELTGPWHHSAKSTHKGGSPSSGPGSLGGEQGLSRVRRCSCPALVWQCGPAGTSHTQTPACPHGVQPCVRHLVENWLIGWSISGPALTGKVASGPGRDGGPQEAPLGQPPQGNQAGVPWGWASSSRGISVASFSQRSPVGNAKGRMQGGWAQANITTRATQLFIKIFYFRRPLKKRPSTSDRCPTIPSACFFFQSFFFSILNQLKQFDA